MCLCAHTRPHTYTSTGPRAYLIQSHAIKFQATSTSAMKLAEVLLVVRNIRGVTNLRGFVLKKNFSPQVPGSCHIYLPIFRKGRGLSQLTVGVFTLVGILPVNLEGSVNVRSLEVNKITAHALGASLMGRERETISGVAAISPQVVTLETWILNNKDVCDELRGCLQRTDSASVLASMATFLSARQAADPNSGATLS